MRGGAQVLDTIFVSVASYRDLECHNTVADLFRQVGLDLLDLKHFRFAAL